MEFLNMIPVGRKNAITAQQLTERAGLKNVRELQQLIHRMREAGYFIMSATGSPSGYYQPATVEEMVPFVRSMGRRVREIRKALEPAKRYIDQTFAVVEELEAECGGDDA